MSDLAELANLIKRRNAIDAEIAALIRRPPHPGHIEGVVATGACPGS